MSEQRWEKLGTMQYVKNRFAGYEVLVNGQTIGTVVEANGTWTASTPDQGETKVFTDRNKAANWLYHTAADVNLGRLELIPDGYGGWKNVDNLKTDAEVLAEMGTEALLREVKKRATQEGWFSLLSPLDPILFNLERKGAADG